MVKTPDRSWDPSRRASQRGACYGIGRKVRPGKSWELPLHIAFDRGQPRFLQWAPQTLTSVPGPGHSQGGLRQPGAAHTPAQHGAAWVH